jgi:hypothetical protein
VQWCKWHYSCIPRVSVCRYWDSVWKSVHKSFFLYPSQVIICNYLAVQYCIIKSTTTGNGVPTFGKSDLYCTQIVVTCKTTVVAWTIFSTFLSACCQVRRALNNSNDHVLALASNFSFTADSHLVCIQSNRDESYHTQAINIHNKPRKGRILECL